MSPKTRVNNLDFSFRDRILLIYRGINKKPGSLDYRLAMIELQRLTAPAMALVLPAVMMLLLCLLAGQGKTEDSGIDVGIMIAPEPMPELEKVKPPREVERQADLDVDLAIPSPVVSETRQANPVAVTPMPQNAVLNVKSPVMLRGILGRDTTGGGGSVGLGSSSRLSGDMVGTLYDLKRNSKGDARSWNYFKDVKDIVLGGLTQQAFSPFYRVGKRVYLSHLFVPQAPADLAPKIFQVDGLMEPRGWVAHYTGRIQPQKSGRYRLIGQFDDYLAVLIDGKVVLETTYTACLHGQSQVVSGWKPTENLWKYRAQQRSQYLTFGDWIRLDRERSGRIDILCGENPGGRIGGVLLIEQEGQHYETAPDGRPIYPPFASGLLTLSERKRLRDSGYRFETTLIPLMNTEGKGLLADGGVEEEDLKVDTGDL